MASVTKRSVKGAALTHAEMDSNFDVVIANSGSVEALNLETGSIEISLEALNGSSGSQDTRLTALEDTVVYLTGSQTISGEKTFGGTQTFNNIQVNGTGSFATIQAVTGSAKIIGDAYIILNNNLPTERYAGIIVQDSGSGSPLTTASLEFDGQTNDWFYEYSDDGGATTDHGVVIFGPEYNTKGSPTYLTSNSIPKGQGDHHLVDSNIIDDGSSITLGSSTTISGSLTVDSINDTKVSGSFTGSFIGDGSGIENIVSSSFSTTSISSSFSSTSISSSFATTASYIDPTFISASAAADGFGTGGGGAGFPFIGDAEITGSLNISGSLVVDGTITELSSERFKTNIQPLVDSLVNVNKLEGVSFVKDGKEEIGLIAENVVNTYPQLVTVDEHNLPLGVEYSRLGPILIEAIKELQNQVNILQEKIEALESKE